MHADSVRIGSHGAASMTGPWRSESAFWLPGAIMQHQSPGLAKALVLGQVVCGCARQVGFSPALARPGLYWSPQKGSMV